MASVYPTLHNKIWFSSGRVPLYDYLIFRKFINFSAVRNRRNQAKKK